MIQQELMKAVKVFRENLKLDVEIDRINDEIEKNEQQLEAEIVRIKDEIKKNEQQLEAEIDRINDEIEKNEQLIIKHFFPFLLSVYKKWKPFLEEKAMCIDLEKQCCFEVTIKNINGDRLRTRVGDDDLYYTLNLKPRLEKYEKSLFIIPIKRYKKIKDLFELRVISR
jgi:hypothetical protein